MKHADEIKLEMASRMMGSGPDTMRDRLGDASRLTASPALRCIYETLDAAPTMIVDRPVALDCELTAATFGLRRSRGNRIYADVPLTALVGLFHRT